MRAITFIMLILGCCCAGSGRGVVSVVDTVDGSPVAGATVIGRSGMIIGRTDGDGAISIAADREFPLTISCIGYEALDMQQHSDTAWLVPAAYELNDVVVTPVARPILRVICFAREYSSGITGTDTLQLYCEYMTESYIAEGKVKGYKKIDAKPSPKGTKRYARIKKADTDSVFRPSYDDDITQLSWFDFLAFLPEEKKAAPQAIMDGAETDSLPGKYGVKYAFRKKNNLFTVTADVLSDHKNRRWSPWLFKLLGMTVDIDAGEWSFSYAANDADTYGIRDYVKSTYNIHMVGRGKWLKKAFGTKYPIDMYTYIEMYPIEIQYCTVGEYKQLSNEYERIPFRYPADLPPLSPEIRRLTHPSD